MKEFLEIVKDVLVILSLVSLLWSSCESRRANEDLTKEVIKLQQCSQSR